MPVYNGSASIRTTLESLFSSDLSEFELVISDDCSTDNSLDIVSEFSEKNIVINRNEKNLGYPKNMQTAFDLCSGDLVVLLAQDDKITSTILSEYIDIFSKNQNLGALSRAYYAYSENENKPIRIKNTLAKFNLEPISLFEKNGNLENLEGILRTLDQLSLLALRKDKVLFPFNEDVFPCHVYPFLSVLQNKGVQIGLYNDYPLAVWVDTSQCINTSWIYDRSPVDSWSSCLDQCLSNIIPLQDLIALKKRFVFENWIGLFQIRNYSRRPLFYTFREVKFMLKGSKANLLNPSFLLTLVLVFCVPKALLIRLVNTVKKQINPLLVKKVKTLR